MRNFDSLLRDFMADHGWFISEMEVKEGRKDDQGKAAWHLVPWEAMNEVVQVLMHGAYKYGPDNWRKVEHAKERYWDAAMRHLIQSQWEDVDEESGKSHFAHAICCLLFLLALEE